MALLDPRLSTPRRPSYRAGARSRNSGTQPAAHPAAGRLSRDASHPRVCASTSPRLLAGLQAFQLGQAGGDQFRRLLDLDRLPERGAAHHFGVDPAARCTQFFDPPLRGRRERRPLEQRQFQPADPANTVRCQAKFGFLQAGGEAGRDRIAGELDTAAGSELLTPVASIRWRAAGEPSVAALAASIACPRARAARRGNRAARQQGRRVRRQQTARAQPP